MTPAVIIARFFQNVEKGKIIIVVMAVFVAVVVAVVAKQLYFFKFWHFFLSSKRVRTRAGNYASKLPLTPGLPFGL